MKSPSGVACAALTGALGWFVAASASQGPIRVDLNMDTDRRDVLSIETVNWRIRAESENRLELPGGASATLRVVDGSPAAAEWWKAGLDFPARLATDGVCAASALELRFSGLPAGRHSLASLHNALGPEPDATFDVAVDGETRAEGLLPSHRVLDDADALAAYVEFDAVDGRDVVVRFTPTAHDGARVWLNGFALGAADPTRVASRPYPGNRDEHAPGDPVLSWRAAAGAVEHRVFLGADASRVANASIDDVEFRGATAQSEFPTAALTLDHMRMWHWRVDTVFADGSVQRGETWRFRPRHLAFPGAEGMGRFAIGGRGGRVIAVTTLEDDGPGSLREAIEAEGPRTVVFRVGGAIRLKSRLVIRNPYITIAGQTAPGDGIAVHGYMLAAGSTHDVIIRFMRIRVGDASGETMDGSGLGGCDHSIMDHCSIAWSIDEGFSSRGAKNFTLQRSIIAEPLNMSVHSHYVGTGKGHGYAGSVSGDVGSIHHNLLVHAAGRNWSLAGGLNQGGGYAGRLSIRNNVVYNWEHRTTDGGVKALDFVGNYYIPGPASRVFHFVMPDFGSSADPQQYHIAGNVMEGRPQYDADNWSEGGVRWHEGNLKRIALPVAEVRALIAADRPFFDSGITERSAEEALESVLADVGASIPCHDSVDTRVLADVRSRDFTVRGSKTGLPGIIDSQADVGGYPEMRGGEPPVDSDGDGMPDAWELGHGLDPADPKDGADLYGSAGYTALETYLDWIVRRAGVEAEVRR
ncbi:hypothetical protein ASA1KI_20790 [Opitutales bacterium ASA1]|uniref:T9SS C-terminal target domain-containing protein n=1 Tax=Congregicoccus parvus TaxID=3081749 RepID=UPI002B29C839|nr:hypothetical protein ASA1KI_20790 [Opitutales bacterium ASA1]